MKKGETYLKESQRKYQINANNNDHQKCTRDIYFFIKILANDGFDPSTLGLWALCASSAPIRLLDISNFRYINQGL